MDNIADTDLLSLTGASNIYRYNIDFPGKYPCLKIIPVPFAISPTNIGLPTMFRLHPRAIIEYHCEEINAENGPEQAAEMLYNLTSILLKDTDVNGWGMERLITDLSVLLDDSNPGNPIRVAALIHQGTSDQTNFA